MNILNTRFKKIIIITLGIVLIMAVLVIVFISPITKYAIEKYDEKYTGRKITLNWAYVNPFTGYVHFSNLKVYEEKSDSVALSLEGLSGNFDILKIFSGNYIISELTLDHPTWMVVKNKTGFNFSSLITHMASDNPDTSKAPGSFNIINVKILGGEFHYLQQDPAVTYFIKEANFESNGRLFDADSVVFKFSFLSGPGTGSVKGNFTVNFKTLDYHYDVVVQKFDLTQIQQYIKPFINYGTFRAKLDADLKTVGNFKNGEDITTRGQLSISDFHFGKNADEDYAAFDKVSLAIDELSPKKQKYLFDSVTLVRPYFKYEKYDNLDNIQTMFGKGGANLQGAAADPAKFNLVIEIGRYVKLLAKNFFSSYYKINRMAIYNADIKYVDFSLNEKFAIALDPLNVQADSIDKNHKRVNVSFASGIEPFGNATINISINPKDTGDFDLNYRFQKIPASLFNPYLISYTSFPLDRGTLELKGSWNVNNGDVKSTNHLLVIDPRVTKKLRNKDNTWIPMPLVMALVRERGNVIDYEIPITGNLKNPKFHLRDVILDLLKNIFVKPVTTPYRMEVKNIEREIEKSLTLNWAMRKYALLSSQDEFADKMTDFLVKNPDASINVYPQVYADKEKEYILFFEAKKKYYLHSKKMAENLLTESDSGYIDKMSVRDEAFLKYINNQIADSMMFTLQQKCTALVGASLVSTKLKELNTERKNTFMAYFIKKKVEKQAQFFASKNVIPYNGFSFYKLEYKGGSPESLIEAYEDMNELNDKAPRNEFEKKRKKSKAPLYDVKSN